MSIKPRSLSQFSLCWLHPCCGWLLSHNTASFCKCFLKPVHLLLHSLNTRKQQVQSGQGVKGIIVYFHSVFPFTIKKLIHRRGQADSILSTSTKKLKLHQGRYLKYQLNLSITPEHRQRASGSEAPALRRAAC